MAAPTNRARRPLVYCRLVKPFSPARRLIAALGWLLLLLAVACGALWQSAARGLQRLDIGAALDEGAVAGFYGRELSDDGSSTSFRWSRPEAELRFRPAPSTLAVSLGGAELGSFALGETFRVYQVPLPQGAAERVGLRASELQLAGDPRSLGLVLDWAEIRRARAAPLWGMGLEALAFPLLPIGLALAALAAALAGARQPLPGLVAALALGALALAAARLPGAELALA